MKNKDVGTLTDAYREYEAGKAFKSRIGLYDRVSRNERFYRGDQWHGVEAGGLPTPVFNIVRRLGSWLVSSVMTYHMSVEYKDRGLSLLPGSDKKRARIETLHLLNRQMADRWQTHSMDLTLRRALIDALLTGNGVFYAYYDENAAGDGSYPGEIVTDVVDATNLFAADMNLFDIQSQEYLILSGRAPVKALQKEARDAGVPENKIALITPDEQDSSYEYGESELDDEEMAKATYLIRFSRNENGFVCFEKCTRSVVIKRVETGMTYYPVTHFYWEPAKNSFHGSTPVSEIIENQKYINKAFAMEMKHMIDTAFSKVIYDKRLIPEWSNEVGQAIGVLSGGDVSGAVTTVGVGEMQDGYIEVMDRVLSYSKEMLGATDTALGEVDPNNTSAILALRETSEIPLDNVRASLYQSVEELAMIWLDLMKEYLPGAFNVGLADGERGRVDMTVLDMTSIYAAATPGPSRRYSVTTQMTLLDRLLDKGVIPVSEYLKRLPEGMIENREELIEIVEKQEKQEENHGKSDG